MMWILYVAMFLSAVFVTYLAMAIALYSFVRIYQGIDTLTRPRKKSSPASARSHL